MVHPRLRFPVRRDLRFLLACIASLSAACGGGGGGGGSDAPFTAPTPLPSPVRPIEPPGPSRSTAEIVLRDGDRLAGGAGVANIEDGALGVDGSAAALVTLSGSGGRRAIVLRAPEGTVTTILDPDALAEDIDATTFSRLRMGPTGELVFQSGSGLDSDRLHLLTPAGLITIAGAPPGPVFPDFRILGNVRIGPGGLVGFVGGGGECTVEVGDDTPRVTCSNALYVAGASGVVRLDDTELVLGNQRPTAVRVEIDPTGGVWFSLPRRASAPVLLHHAAGGTTAVLHGDTVLPEVGLLTALEAVAANTSGAVLVEGSLQAFEGERRPKVLGLLRGEDFALIAREGTDLGGANVATLRGIALDASGRALFEARLGPSDAPAEQVDSLWLGGPDGLVEVVREQAPFPGEETRVFTLGGSRLNARGDVAFVTELGSRTGSSARIEEIRATVRRADGALVTVASSRHTGQFGALSDLQIVGFGDLGRLLLIGQRGSSSDRVLLLGGSEDAG